MSEGLFFIVVTPHFERLALYELQGALAAFDLSLGDYEVFAGGIELRLPFAVGLSLNKILKIPTRILLRVETREILSFRDFELFVKSISWKSFGPLREIYVSSRSSKMKMKEAIKDAFKKAVPFKSQKNGTDVYVRVFRDLCTLSVDTSGDDLFQRGREKWVGEAPIRDTMAAGLLQMALQPAGEAQGWEIVDPMMGCGTFLTEALTFKKSLKRTFCFENWTGDYRVELPPIKEDSFSVVVRGRDKDAKNVETAKKNLASLGVTDSDLQQEDLFSDSPASQSAGTKRLVILNPPYGKRIAIKEKNFFQNTIQAIARKYNPDRLAMITPRGVVLEQKGYEKIRHMPFSNNGIDVEFHVFLKKSLI